MRFIESLTSGGGKMLRARCQRTPGFVRQRMQMRYALVLLAPLAISGQVAFEVASIRPSPPQPMGHTSIWRSTDQGRLKFTNVSILDLISDAYRVQHRQVSGPD